MYMSSTGIATADELYPAAPDQHAALLHPLKAKGRLFLPSKASGWIEGDAHEPWQVDAVLWDAQGESDRYVSMNRFAGRRRVVAQVLALCAAFSDVDYYKMPELRGLPPEAVLVKALKRLRAAGAPDPSLALCSGQGLQLTWRHEPIGRKDLPAWNAVQDRIYGLLEPMGADGSQRHAAAVLRLAGTTNSKNGGMVRSLRDPGERSHRFGDLVDALVKSAPEWDEDRQGGADLYSIAVRRAAKGLRNHPRGWSEASLWEGRLTDLQRLRRMRYGSGVMEDHRDRWLFIATTAISWLVVPEVLGREVMALAEEAGGWDRRHARSDLGQVLKRARRSAAGEKIEFKGQMWDTRHHFKNETIIDWLEITTEEEREMVVTISPQEEARRKRLRDREYQERRRRAAGAPIRARYDQSRSGALRKKTAAARHLKKCGLSTKEIAERMEVSDRTVQRWLK